MKILFVCDSIEKLNYSKDSTIFLIERAWKENYEASVCNINDLSVIASSKGPVVFAKTNLLSKPNDNDGSQRWWEDSHFHTACLDEFDIIFIRTDPPFDEKYSAATLILSIAEDKGVKIFNSPKALMNHNEKLSTLDFYKYIPPTLISSEKKEIIDFTKSFKKVVFKPLNEMGGSGIFVVENNDSNIPTIIEVLTKKSSNKIVVQKFLPEIENGDKRILILNGEIVNCCLTRTPKKGSYIGNLAAGGIASIKPLSFLDRQIAEEVAGSLASIGFFILGLDIIGENLTEINVTSPTGFKEITALSKIDVGKLFYSQVNNVLGKN
jgi:glutathione synthase